MFDLFRSQDKMKRIMLGGILAVVSLGMLLYLIPTGPSLGGPGSDAVVAEVAGTKITEDQVYRHIREVFGNAQIPAATMAVYVPQVIQAMISDLAVAYRAERMGFKISDAEIGRLIRTSPQFANLPPEQEEAALRQMGWTVEEFVNGYRKNATANFLNALAAEGIVVTPQEAENAYRQTNTKIKIEYIVFDSNKLKSDIAVSPADVKSFYEAKKAGYTVPESRNLQVILIDQDKVALTVQTPETQLLAYYNANKNEFQVKDRIKARHILLRTDGKSADDAKKQKAKAEDLLKQIKGGADFAKLATANTEDEGTKDKGGELDWLQRDQLEKPFGDAAFALKPGQVSDLVTTRYGFHIIQLEDKEQAGLQPYDKVKGQIAAKITNQQVFDKMQALAAQARAQLLKAPQNAQQIAAQLGLQFVRADNVPPEGVIPGVGVNKDLSAAIAGLGKGQVSDTVQIAPTRLAVAAVVGVNPPRTQPLSEVEGQVRAALIGEKSVQLVQQKAKEAAGLLTTNGGNMEAVAKGMGLEVKTSEPFTRNGSVAGTMGASYFGDAFTKPVGSTLGPINAGGQTVVVKVVEKTEPDMKEFAAQKDSIVAKLKDQKLQERNLLFQDSVLYKLSQEGKIKVYKDVEQRIMSRYQQS